MWYLSKELEGQVCIEIYHILLSYRPWCQNMVGRDSQPVSSPPLHPSPNSVHTANTFASSCTDTLAMCPSSVHNFTETCLLAIWGLRMGTPGSQSPSYPETELADLHRP